MHSCMLSKYQNSPSDLSLLEAYEKLNIKYKRFSFLKRVLMKDNLIHQELIFQFHLFFDQNMVSIKNIILHWIILV